MEVRALPVSPGPNGRSARMLLWVGPRYDWNRNACITEMAFVVDIDVSTSYFYVYVLELPFLSIFRRCVVLYVFKQGKLITILQYLTSKTIYVL